MPTEQLTVVDFSIDKSIIMKFGTQSKLTFKRVKASGDTRKNFEAGHTIGRCSAPNCKLLELFESDAMLKALYFPSFILLEELNVEFDAITADKDISVMYLLEQLSASMFNLQKLNILAKKTCSVFFDLEKVVEAVQELQ